MRLHDKIVKENASALNGAVLKGGCSATGSWLQLPDGLGEPDRGLERCHSEHYGFLLEATVAILKTEATYRNYNP